MDKVEKFRITKDGKKYLKKVKALSEIRKLLAKKKQQVDVTSMALSEALNQTHQNLLQATQIPGEELMENISLMEESHG